MEQLLSIRPAHLEAINPLLKWRILDQKTLWEESSKTMGYRGFQKILARLEGVKILESKIIPYIKRKYVYLSPVGEKIMNEGGRPLGINKENFFHDARLADLMRELIKIPTFSNFLFEHEIIDKSFLRNVRHIPDALLIGRKKNVEFKLAVELEVTRKSFSRIEEKVRFYLDEGEYDYVVYFFVSKRIKEAYENFLIERFKDSVKDRFFFFVLDEKGETLESKGTFRGEEKILKEVFL